MEIIASLVAQLVKNPPAKQETLVPFLDWEDEDLWRRNRLPTPLLLGFPGGSDGKESWVDPWIEKIPWRRAWQPMPVFLPEESRGQRTVVGYSPWGCKERLGTQSAKMDSYNVAQSGE